MKINKLIKSLQNLAKTCPDFEVALSSDAEGNSFKMLDMIYPLKSKELFDVEFGEVIELDLQKGDTYNKKAFKKVIILFPK